MRRWEWRGGRWEYRLPAVPQYVYWAALAGGFLTWGLAWLVFALFLCPWLILRETWVGVDPRDTEELIALELGGSSDRRR